ncbi:MAG: hypothetical protein WCG45_04385 [bacterium]
MEIKKGKGARLNSMLCQVSSQMMRNGKHGKLNATEEQKEKVRKKYEEVITWTIKNMPKCSSGVMAVIVKSFIKYENKERIAKFCISLQKALFEGETDPVYKMWVFLQKHRGKDSVSAYKKAVCAIRAYANNKQLKKLEPACSDIFDWAEDYNLPKEIEEKWTEKEVERICNINLSNLLQEEIIA